MCNGLTIKLFCDSELVTRSDRVWEVSPLFVHEAGFLVRPIPMSFPKNYACLCTFKRILSVKQKIIKKSTGLELVLTAEACVTHSGSEIDLPAFMFRVPKTSKVGIFWNTSANKDKAIYFN